MEAGWRKRGSRIAAWGVLGLCAVVFAAVAGAPLLLRGSRLSWMLERFTPPMQGKMSVGGGSLGWDAAFTLAMGQPTKVRLVDVEILDPEGVEVLSAKEIRAHIQIQRDPLRVNIHDLRPGVARWRFARMQRQPGIGFLAAFRGPAAAITRSPQPRRQDPRPTSESRPPQRPVSFSIVSAHLDGLSATFDFPGWGLVLNDVKGQGHLTIRSPSGANPPTLSFDVRDVDARGGGFLRILRGRAQNAVGFDRVSIERIGTSGGDGGARDLLLLVKDAATGRSHLSGRALFGGVLSRRAAGQPAPGMQIDARWSNAGDALTALGESRGLRGLTVSGDSAEVQASVVSSYRDLDGTFQIRGVDVDYRGLRLLGLAVDLLARGPPYSAELRQIHFRSPAGGEVEASGTFGPAGVARMRLRLGQLGTDPWLPRYLRPLLGGVASGYLALRGDLRADTVVLEGLDLSLLRSRRGPLPRLLRLHTGTRPGRTSFSSGAGDGAEEALVASLRGARWQRGRLSTNGLVAEGFGGRLTADAALVVQDAAGAPLPSPRLDLALAVAGVELARALPGAGLHGRLSFDLGARGPLDDLQGQLAFPQGASLRVLDQPYQLPGGTAVLLRGDELRLPRLVLGAPAGGSIILQGSVQTNQSVDLRLEIANHRLERIPYLARALPSLSGRFDGNLEVRGTALQPQLDGQFRLGGVSLQGVGLGDGNISLRPAGAGQTVLSGRLFRHLALEGRVVTGAGGPRVTAEVTATDLRLDPFLPPTPVLEGGKLTVSGRFGLTATGQTPFSMTATLESVALEVGCAPTARAPRAGCLRLANYGPVRVRSAGGQRRLELEPSRLHAVGGESDVVVAAVIEDGGMRAVLEGRLGAELAGPLLRRWPVTVNGVLDAALEANGPVGDPALRGTLRVRHPISVRVRRLPWDLRLVSGALSFDPTGVHSEGLELEAPGARLRLAGSAPLQTGPGQPRDFDRRPLTLLAKGQVAGTFLARAFPTAIAEAQGELTVDARLDGTLAEPRFSGEARVAPMSLRLRWQDARLDIRSGRILARGRRLILEELTADLSGPAPGTSRTRGLPPGGRLQLGPPGKPGEVEVLALYPLRLGAVRLPVVGRRLQLETSGLSLRGSDLALVLAGNGTDGPLALTGEVAFKEAHFSPNQRSGRRPGAGARLVEKLPSGVKGGETQPVALDVAVRGERLVVDPGWLPDVHLGVDVRVGGTTSKPFVNWHASGKGLYSVIALFLYRLFS